MQVYNSPLTALPNTIKITFLGTGTSQGVPVIACTCPVCSSIDFRDKRLRTSVMLETAGACLVVDSGPDFRQQMLRERVKALDAILFTHEHKDHVAGLDEVRSFNFSSGGKYMPVYAEQRVLEHIKTEFAYAFEEIKYPGVPLIDLYPITLEPFTAAGVPILPVGVMHHKLPVTGFRMGNFTYITDANYIAPSEIDKIRGSEIMVLNGLQKEPHVSHYTLEQALEVIAEINPGKAYLTHISHKLGLHSEVQKELPENVFLAYDGLQLYSN